MDSLDLTTFITIDTLKTLTGQVLVIVVFTQLVKELALGYLDDHLKIVAVLLAMWVQFVINMLDGSFLTYTLIVINGAVVAVVAFKGAEMLKGRKEAPPPGV